MLELEQNGDATIIDIILINANISLHTAHPPMFEKGLQNNA
jgi:hypothetical protein